MEKKPISHSAFLSLRALIALLLCASVCFTAVGTEPAFLHPEARAKVSNPARDGLTFAERVLYQRAIEEVYWRHRIWPKENPNPKPSLDAVMSHAQMERKVEDYLSKSQALQDYWQRPITAEQLQTEIDRTAQHTKRPEVLRELFEALGNNPFVIAECLARPIVAERLAAYPTVAAGVSRAPTRLSIADTAASTEKRLRAPTNQDRTAYILPEISAAPDCSDDTWIATTTLNAPDARDGHTAVWTGSEMIIWGGAFLDNAGYHFFNTGGSYNPATDSWTATITTNAPIARWLHAAVWTGSEMIIWGGGDGTDFLNTGGRYNPTSDSWTATSTTSAPAARVYHTAVWTGSQMIVWGGYNYTNLRMNSGGRYDPSTDTWIATSITSAPEARWAHTAEWTGTEMIVWGGTNRTIYLNTGSRYNPATDTWVATGVPNDVLGRASHTAVWTGDEMIVWGGADSTFSDCNTGGRYSPSTDNWVATSIGNAPSPRDSHTAIWNGSEMVVWGGIFCCPAIDFNTGGRYNPGIDSWASTSTVNAPFARENHTTVWTGSEMIVWGGYNYTNNLFFNSGGRYCAQSGPTATPTPTATATPSSTTTPTPTATPTSTPRPTPTPRIAPTPRGRPTPRPRS
jgi:N-acetylneuraminic acid mutarotase